MDSETAASRMIITQLNSGLGNQLFQYAAGKSLAVHHGTKLKLDISWYDQVETMQTVRRFELGIYNLSEPIATAAEICKLTHPSSTGLISRFRNKLLRSQPPHKQRVYEEPHFHIDPHFFNSRKHTLLVGYWQSEFYFKPVEREIRSAFSLIIPNEGKNGEWLKKIKTSEAVSLHVRRGDMVNNPEVARVHGSCDMEYYLTAISKIAELVVNPEFFIFSDDPAWCLQHLNISFPHHVIDNNQGTASYLDLQLMRQCKHHIIANSSFSWWGAWLNDFGGKKVVSPKRWFNHTNHDTKDLIPADWMRI